MPVKYLTQKAPRQTFRVRGARQAVLKPLPGWKPPFDPVPDNDNMPRPIPDNDNRPPGRPSPRPPQRPPPGGWSRPPRPGWRPGMGTLPWLLGQYLYWDFVKNQHRNPFIQSSGYYRRANCNGDTPLGWRSLSSTFDAMMCYRGQLIATFDMPAKPTNRGYDLWADDSAAYGPGKKKRVATFFRPDATPINQPGKPLLPYRPNPVIEGDPYPDVWKPLPAPKPVPIIDPPSPWPNPFPAPSPVPGIYPHPWPVPGRPVPIRPVPVPPPVVGRPPKPNRPPKPEPIPWPPWWNPRPEPTINPKPTKPPPGTTEQKHVWNPIPPWVPDVTEVTDFLECLMEGVPGGRKKGQTHYDALMEAIKDGTFDAEAFLLCLAYNQIEDMLIGALMGWLGEQYYPLLDELLGEGWKPPPGQHGLIPL